MKMLLVDDSKAVHAYIGSLLQGKNCDIISAYDGQSGLEILRSQGDEIDLVLLDIEMPKMTGFEVLVEARKFSTDVPIIMVTSKNQPSEITKLIEAGADE